MQPIHSLALVAALACPVVAQSKPCLALNETSTPTRTVTTAVAKSYAFSFTTTSAITVQSARLFTGSSNKVMQLGIRAGGSRPGNVLAVGTWTSTPGPEWQGCNFDRALSLAASTQYWLVWQDPGASTLPTGTSGTQTTVLGGIGTVWLSLPPDFVMMRFYCGLLDDTNVVPAGTPCAASTGSYGSVFTNAQPRLGNTSFALEASGFPPSATAILLFGAARNFPATPIPFPGADPSCRMHTAANVAIFVARTDGAGYLRVPAPIPSLAVLKGAYGDLQVAAEDTGSKYALPVVTSNRLGLTVY